MSLCGTDYAIGAVRNMYKESRQDNAMVVMPSKLQKGLPRRTGSLCPECLKVIPATLYIGDGALKMKKTCKEHGEFDEVCWSDAEMYLRAENWAFDGVGLENPQIVDAKVCPYECGLCNLHYSATSLCNIDLTNRCNLKCPICFANANAAGYVFEPTFEQIVYEFAVLRAQRPIPVAAIQFAGGEPTIYPQFPEIVKAAKDMGFPQVQVATNGIRLATEAGVPHGPDSRGGPPEAAVHTERPRVRPRGADGLLDPRRLVPGPVRLPDLGARERPDGHREALVHVAPGVRPCVLPVPREREGPGADHAVHRRRRPHGRPLAPGARHEGQEDQIHLEAEGASAPEAALQARGGARGHGPRQDAEDPEPDVHERRQGRCRGVLLVDDVRRWDALPGQLQLRHRARQAVRDSLRHARRQGHPVLRIQHGTQLPRGNREEVRGADRGVAGAACLSTVARSLAPSPTTTTWPSTTCRACTAA